MVQIDTSRDALLTPFGKETLADRYLLPGEGPQDIFARVASAYADNSDHAQRLYDYMSNLWFMPATPVLSNGGTDRGLPISCYLNAVDDSLDSIVGTWTENVWLASKGGGIGTYWGNVRAIGEKVGAVGKTSGIIPFVKVMDSLTLAISQGCVDGETEILTERGWVRFDELNSLHGKVAQVNENKTISFVEVEEYHSYPYSGVMHHYTNGGTVDHFVTPNHRMVTETLSHVGGKRFWQGELRAVESSNFNAHRDNRIYVTGTGASRGGSELTDYERFLIAYQADGSTKPTGTSTGAKSGALIYAFRFRRERKKARLRALLDRLGWEFTENTYANSTTSFLVRVPLALRPSKHFNHWVSLANRSREWCAAFIDEMQYWDGSGHHNTIRYDSTDQLNADLVCAIACLAGFKAFTAQQTRAAPRRPLFKTHIHTGTITVGGECLTKSSVDFNGMVYCVSVPSGMFLARRNGRTLVTGNSLRRGSAAVYIDISHPEIEEFLEIRKPSGDFNRKSLNLHHGVLVSDAFMGAVKADAMFELVSPVDGSVRKQVHARTLFVKLVETRMATGEPYIVFSDTVNRSIPEHTARLGLKVTTSNLCAEIMLPTGIDHLGNDRTAVCCLSSVNLEKWDEWNSHPDFLEDVMCFLDNVLQDYIDRAPQEMSRAAYAAHRERSVGLGVMGFHSYLQSKGWALEGALAKGFNLRVFRHLRRAVDLASVKLAEERGACPDAADMGVTERFSCKMAVAPTASISIICGGVSACIEPIPANIYTHKTLSGSHTVRNPHLDRLLWAKGINPEPVWLSILENEGSVQHLACLSDEEKAVFRTAFEIDQRWLIELAADRAPYVDQAVSNNLFLLADTDKWDVLMLHYKAWERGIKSLYYLRSKSIQRAAFAGGVERDNTLEHPQVIIEPVANYEECLACT